MTKEQLLNALDDVYILWLKENRQIGSETGDALMLLGRIVLGEEPLPCM